MWKFEKKNQKTKHHSREIENEKLYHEIFEMIEREENKREIKKSRQKAPCLKFSCNKLSKN